MVGIRRQCFALSKDSGPGAVVLGVRRIELEG